MPSSVVINLPPIPLPVLSSTATIAALRALPSAGFVNGQDIAVDGDTTSGDGGGGLFTWNDGSTADDNGTTIIRPTDTLPLAAGRWVEVGSSFEQTGGVPSSVQEELRRWVWAEQYGLSASASAATNTAAIRAAIDALRGPATVLSTDGLNSGPITVYSSGELLIGAGVFAISPDVLKITQDLGLVIKGRGSRKTNNAVIGRSVLLITGASTGFGIQVQGNGARGLVLEDIDVCYASSAFVGDVLDNFGSPGMVLNRCHLGTHGISGGTRLQTARCCVRSTYSEFIEITENTTLDGAVDGIWFDDAREPPLPPENEFGGSGMTISGAVFYDFTGRMIRHDGLRNLKKLTLKDTAFNPITVNCTHAIDVSNVDAFSIEGCLFSPSVASVPTDGWLRLRNVTGSLENNEFLGNVPIGTLDGHMSINNNFFDTTTGPELLGGIFTGAGNEFSRGTAGFKISTSPMRALSFRLGPDLFKDAVTYSYDIETDNALLDGRIDYAATQDASAQRFRNVSGRVAIRNGSEKRITIAATPYNVLRTDTGYRIELTAVAAEAVLPAVNNPGLKYTLFTNGTNVIKITAPAGTLLVGGGGVKTSMTSGGDQGSYVVVENFAGFWNVTTQVGSFTYA